MCGKENRLIGYSERGVMNALFYSIANDKTEMENFLKLTGQSFSLQDDYKIYMEHSLSQFGTPDAVITDAHNVFFIEAKVCKGDNNWSIKTELEKFDNYKNKVSNKPKYGLFTQLYWKTLLNKDGIEQDEFSDRTRKIGSNEVVTDFFEKIKNRTLYYICIIPTSETLSDLATDKRNELEKFFGEDNKNLFLIPWQKIEKEFSYSYQLLFDVFEHNRNQIYIKEENN